MADQGMTAVRMPTPPPRTSSALSRGPLLGLGAGLLERLLWLAPGELALITEGTASWSPDDLGGERAARAAALTHVDELLLEALGERRVVDHWLRRRNPALAGERPLDWLAGPSRQIAQLEMRLERERADRRWRPAHA